MVAFGSNPNPGGDQPSASPSRSEPSAAPDRTNILVVEDNKADVFLIREALAAANLNVELNILADGEKAIRFFEMLQRDESIACPALVILDINLPRKHGSQVIREMKESRRCSEAIVVVVTSSDAADDREEMARLGAQAYFRKPSDYQEFMKLGPLIRALLEEAGAVSSSSDPGQ